MGSGARSRPRVQLPLPCLGQAGESQRNRATRYLAVAVVALVVGVSVGIVQAGHSDPNEIHVCVDMSGSGVFVPDPGDCAAGTTVLTWNQQGVPGANGLDGVDGIDGLAGIDGIDGIQGPPGAPGGPPGPPGDVGPAGPQGPAGVDGSDATFVAQQCDEGFEVIGIESDGTLVCNGRRHRRRRPSR